MSLNREQRRAEKRRAGRSAKPGQNVRTHKFATLMARASAAPQAFDEMTASTTEPLPLARRAFYIESIRWGIEGMRTAEQPTTEHWRVVSDCINQLEILVEMGEIADDGGWIAQAVFEMGAAGKRAMAGGAIRLSGEGLRAVGEALEGFEAAITGLPERTIVQAQRRTHARLQQLLHCRARSSGAVQVVSL